MKHLALTFSLLFATSGASSAEPEVRLYGFVEPLGFQLSIDEVQRQTAADGRTILRAVLFGFRYEFAFAEEKLIEAIVKDDLAISSATASLGSRGWSVDFQIGSEKSNRFSVLLPPEDESDFDLVAFTQEDIKKILWFLRFCLGFGEDASCKPLVIN